MQEIKFYHSQISSLTIAILFGLLFILSSTVTVLFLLNLIQDLTLSKIIIFAGMSILPIIITLIFGRKFVKNMRNNKPICTLTSSEFVYTEFYYRATVIERIPINNIKKVSMGKTFIDRKIIISLEIYNNMNPLTLNYLTDFLTEKDKKILVNELKKRITKR